MNNKTIIPDSSFYICFLDDIKETDYLIRLIDENCFAIGQIVKNEIKKSNHYDLISDCVNSNVTHFDYHNYGEILKPFFSLEEINIGEHEVIAIAYIHDFIGKQVIIVLDDREPVRYIHNNFPHMATNVTGTVGFIEIYTRLHRFSKDEALYILIAIKNSKFRIHDQIIDGVIERINGDYNV